MSIKFRLLEIIITTTSDRPIATSYEIICAAERMLPRKAYFEFDDQPARMMPYTPIDVTAMTKSRPALTLATTRNSLNGMTAQATSAGAKAKTGASR